MPRERAGKGADISSSSRGHARTSFWLEELRALEARMPRFRFVPVLSHPRNDDAWTGEKGGMASVLARLLPRLDEHEAYLCGGAGMIDSAIAALRSRGIAEERVFFDKFS